MNCPQIQSSFLDYLDGRLPPAATAEVREHLATCPACQREWAALQEISLKLDRLPPVVPGPRLRTQFYAMLETHRQQRASRSPFVFMRGSIDRFFAAILPARPALQFALTGVALVLGLWLGARLRRPAAPPPAEAATERELATLRARVEAMGTKVDSMDQLVSYSMLQRQPANQRLKAVLATLDLKQTDQAVISGLLNTLAFDPSVNVRLSALEALYPHANLPEVRSAVAAALPREPSPLIQVTMIDFLAASRDTAASGTLEDVSRSPNYDPSVRDAARRAIALL